MTIMPLPLTARSPNTRWVLSGPFARIHERDELLDDLEYAVKQHTTPTVLVLFGFHGLKEQLETMPERDGNRLLGELAEQLAASVGNSAVLYEPRRGEFGALFDGRPAAVIPTMEAVKAELDAFATSLGLKSEVGYVELPSSGLDPAATLARADRRLQERAGTELRPTPSKVTCLVSAREAKKLSRRQFTQPRLANVV
jgi:GGDEF domain-containing protein